MFHTQREGRDYKVDIVSVKIRLSPYKAPDRVTDTDNSHLWSGGGFMIIRLDTPAAITGTFQLCHGDHNFPVSQCQDLRGGQFVLHIVENRGSNSSVKCHSHSHALKPSDSI